MPRSSEYCSTRTVAPTQYLALHFAWHSHADHYGPKTLTRLEAHRTLF